MTGYDVDPTSDVDFIRMDPLGSLIVTAKLSAELGIAVTITDFHETPTVQALADRLQAR